MQRTLLRKIWLALMVAILLACGAFAWAQWLWNPVYRGEMTCGVMNSVQDGQQDYTAVNEVTAMIAEVLSTDTVRKELQTQYAQLQDFRGEIYAVQVGQSNLLTITATGQNRQQVLLALQTMEEMIPSFSKYLSSRYAVQCLQAPMILPETGTQPQAGLLAIICGLAGFVLTIGCLLWWEMRKNRLTKGTQAENQPLEPVDLRIVWSRFYKLLRCFWYCVPTSLAAVAVLFSVGGYMVYTPEYEAVAQITVTASTAETTDTTYYDNAAAEQLAKSLPHLLETQLFRQALHKKLDLQTLDGKISAQAVAQTNRFVLTVSSGDPQAAYDILQGILECYQQVAAYIVPDPQMIVHRQPQVPSQPSNTFSWQVMLAKGGALGLIGSVTVLTVLAFSNKVSVKEKKPAAKQSSK